ncbi:cellulose biosynthesis cyclic di-GMP-binding regulatory protein BcsB [Kurthia sibirica]|uniref:Cellulose synthase n=1 Tax=Kurthia sibirica TaxID=202750 RepID=A0A2U3AND4_9BACL|nr:cellulose biosynthesis cyclic di-GMP-binding regulatory protein BcsB [Kurthia sibirica]PWI26042.1 hypothetical protein DEX24_05800 [Kurthia sibirica]GEK34557.1 hypothetical protein KSI01_20900 [Kurthia sibirica]
MTKKTTYLLFVMLLLVTSLVVMSRDAQAAEKLSITEQSVNLQGPDSVFNYNYYLPEQASDQGNELTLNIAHSALLIKPSSLTIRVDGDNKKTVALKGDEKQSTLTIPLSGKALKKGTHMITIAYYGIIKEGVCVENNTSGNWLRINPASYLRINGNATSSTVTLADYPTKFTAFEAKTSVVIPEKASTSTTNAALKVLSYLKKQTTKPQNMIITTDRRIKSGSDHLIFIGQTAAFKSADAKKLLMQAQAPKKADALNLSISQQISPKNKRIIMSVTAQEDQILQKKISVLTDPRIVKQLANKTMSVSSLPEKENNDSGTVTFKEMSIEDFELSNALTKSPHHFYYLPQNYDHSQDVSITLLLKKSVILKADKAELIVMVNDIPHSVSLKNMDKEDGFFKVRLTLEKSALKNQNLVDLQFVLNGSKTNNPCTTNDENKWLFFSENSTINFAISDKQQPTEVSLTAFPSIFSNADKSTAVVVSQLDDKTIADLTILYSAATMGTEAPHFELYDASTINPDELKNRHSIIIGDVAALTADLQKNDQMTYVDKKIDLAKEGFLAESVARYATVQQSPWDHTYLTMTLNKNEENEANVSKKLLTTLQNMQAPATIIVQSKDQQLFTNSDRYQAEKANSDTKKTVTSSLSTNTIVYFIVLLIIVVAVLIFVLRKRKK